MTEVYSLQCVTHYVSEHETMIHMILKDFVGKIITLIFFQESLTEATSMLVTDVANE